jgi:hypothetical protein
VKSQEHVHHFLWHQGDCSHAVSPNTQFRIKLKFYGDCDCVKISPRISTTKEHATTKTTRRLLHQGMCEQNWTAAILTQPRWPSENRRRCPTPAHNKTSRTHLNMAEALGASITQSVSSVRLALTKGPNRIGVSIPSRVDGSRFSLRNVAFSS